jgi:hypothetical protein
MRKPCGVWTFHEFPVDTPYIDPVITISSVGLFGLITASGLGIHQPLEPDQCHLDFKIPPLDSRLPAPSFPLFPHRPVLAAIVSSTRTVPFRVSEGRLEERVQHTTYWGGGNWS